MIPKPSSPASAVALVPAAGNSLRFNAHTPKVLLSLDGVPILRRVLQTLHSVDRLRTIVVMVRREDVASVRELVADLGRVRVIEGGHTRQASVQSGILYAQEQCRLLPEELVLIHDAARCLVRAELIAAALEAAVIHRAVTVAVPVVDTIHTVREAIGQAGAQGVELLTECLNRSQLRAVQTPQVFRAEYLVKAHQNQAGAATDDASLVSALYPVVAIPGDTTNIKVTYPHDLAIAEVLLHQRQEARSEETAEREEPVKPERLCNHEN